jgi:hypothetical protein
VAWGPVSMAWALVVAASDGAELEKIDTRSNTKNKPLYGANGVYYRVVPTP